MNKLKEHFHIVIVVLLVMLIAPIGYYYAYALPKFNIEKLNIEKQKQDEEIKLKKEAAEADKAKQEEEIKLKKEAAEADKAKQDAIDLEKANKDSMLSECLSDAELSYHNNWSAACRSLANSNRESLSTCVGSYCASLYKVDDSPSCSLPGGRADTVNKYWTDAKDECFKRYK